MNYLLGIVFLICTIKTHSQNKEDTILGKWESTEKNLIVQVYKQDNTFKARIVWFYDEIDTALVNTRLDEKNPDKALQSRKIIGLDVLSGLVYNPRQNKWTGGKIYDTHSGKTWNATVRLTSPDLMNVRGFYGVRLLGKTLNFKRL